MMDRREALLAAALVTAGAAEAEAGAPTLTGAPEPSLSFVFQFEATLGAPLELGNIDGMRRRIIPITGGRISGPRLQGEVMPGGADWQGIREGDGFTRISAQYWVKAADGAVISVSNNGVRRAEPEIMRRMYAGEMVPPASYYFRAAPVFETGAPAHRWLNESLFICVGARMPNNVLIRIYQVG